MARGSHAARALTRPTRRGSDRRLQLERRFPVEIERDAAALTAPLRAHGAAAPSGAVEPVEPWGFAFRREPDVFAAVGTGSTLGLGLLLTELTLRRPSAMRAPSLVLVAIVLAALGYLVAGLLASRFLLNALSSFVVRAVDGRVVCATRLLGRERPSSSLRAEELVSVDVVRDDEGRLRVVARGPRHEVKATIYTLRALDPEALAAWLAEGVALVARAAGARPIAKR